jgi:hypothetical protein
MRRLFETCLLSALLVAAMTEASQAAPAPFPKSGRTNDSPFVQMLRKKARACGYRLHEIKPGPQAGEWILMVSSLDSPEPPREKWLRARCPEAVFQKMDDELDELIALVLALAEIEAQEQHLPPSGPRKWRRVKLEELLGTGRGQRTGE